MTHYKNYFLTSKNSRLIHGHIDANGLYDKILKHDGSTAYCCYFDLDENYLKYEYDTGKVDHDGKKVYQYKLRGQKPSSPDYKCNGQTFTQYEGPCKPALDCVSFDFDSPDPEQSLIDVRKFVDWLDIENLAVFFSGSKGFHVMVPFGYFKLEANEHLPNQLKDLAKHLKESFPTLDDGIYNYNRKFRVPFTKHEKTGLYKNQAGIAVDIDYIKEHATVNNKYNFLEHINFFVEPLEVITEAIEQSKRKSYEIEKHRAGTVEKPSPFEAYDNKLCIQKMLESRCDDIGRNNACLRIVNDYFRTGKTQAKCFDDVHKWAAENGLPASEVNIIVSNIYERGSNYNFGCQDEFKSMYCSAKCSIWKKLDPEKRPVTVDMPMSDYSGKMPSEFTGVQWIMDKMFGSKYVEDKKEFESGFIIKQDARTLFYFKDNHWQHVDDAKIHQIKTNLNGQYDNRLTTRKLDSVFKMLLLYVPEKPEDVDLFSPRNDMANFKDGTLHLERNKEGRFELNFRAHNMDDFCTTIIDLNYRDYLKNKSQVNSKFEDWLFKFIGESDDSFKLLGEMFGASLMPKFPQFFVLIGKSGTGKSTTIKVLKQLHKNEKNISGVSPDKFHGFHMASMIGKLMNIVGDIKTNCRIDDDTVKQVDDQEVCRIEIKGQADVYTKLPALHIFGANKMPSTSEGYSGAMKRRFSIINFDKVYEGKRNTEIAKDMFEFDPVGVLAFAMRGLERLVCQNNGEYTRASKSQDNVDQWSKKSDIIWQFLNSVCDEPIDVGGRVCQLEIIENEKILRSDLAKTFLAWQEEFIEQRNHIGKMRFFQLLEEGGFSIKNSNKGKCVRGIREISEADESI